MIFTHATWAAEVITSYNVDIDVAQSGDLLITETIDVNAEGRQIQRGIFLELPRRYSFDGVELDYNYEIISICLLYTSPSPRDRQKTRMPSSA